MSEGTPIGGFSFNRLKGHAAGAHNLQLVLTAYKCLIDVAIGWDGLGYKVELATP